MNSEKDWRISLSERNEKKIKLDEIRSEINPDSNDHSGLT